MKIMKYGFTIIELLIVIGIVVVMAVAGFLSLYSFRGEKYLDLTSQEIINVLRDAQDRSISREEDGHWGVHFENSVGGDNFYELFKGASYADSVKYSRFSLKSGIEFNDPASGANTDIIFQPITGWPSAPTTIKISSKNDSSKNSAIAVSVNGLISLPSLPQISSWVSLAPTLADIRMGGALASIGADAVYALRGSNYSTFWKYTISAGSWQQLPDVPGQASVGIDGDLVSVGDDSIYALRAAGAGQDNFWRYNISAGNWTNLADIPNVSGLYEPITLIAVGNEVYANKGISSNNFYKYNISTGIWTKLSDSPDFDYGSDATVVGTDAIYATKGEYEKNFYKYTISSNSWSNLADAPLGIGLGGSLTTVGADIYALRGDATNNFWKYDTLTNIWSDAASALDDVDAGGSLTTVDADTIYALRGFSTTDFWRFDIF